VTRIRQFRAVDSTLMRDGATLFFEHLEPDAGQWKNPLRFSGNQRPDKVSIARFVTEQWPPDAIRNLRLERHVRAVVELVRTANGHST